MRLPFRQPFPYRLLLEVERAWDRVLGYIQNRLHATSERVRREKMKETTVEEMAYMFK